MSSYTSKNITHYEVYKKAIAIFGLSRAIASYIGNDKSILSLSTSNNTLDTYSANLVMESMDLPQKIVRSHISKDINKQKKYLYSLERAIHRLNAYCEYLEYNYSQARDYINLLRSELISFRQEKFKWEKSLIKKTE